METGVQMLIPKFLIQFKGADNNSARTGYPMCYAFAPS